MVNGFPSSASYLQFRIVFTIVQGPAFLGNFGSIGSFFRGGLEPKTFHDKRIYKGHRDIEKKASHHSKKASIPLKMYLKNPAILEKALNFSEKLIKIIEIFLKPLHF
jgi:hypothetical protein